MNKTIDHIIFISTKSFLRRLTKYIEDNYITN